jgi:hypothetical protein
MTLLKMPVLQRTEVHSEFPNSPSDMYYLFNAVSKMPLKSFAKRNDLAFVVSDVRFANSLLKKQPLVESCNRPLVPMYLHNYIAYKPN